MAFVGLTVRIEGVFDVRFRTYKDTLLFKLFYELDDVVFAATGVLLDVVSIGADVFAVIVVIVIVATVVVVIIFAAAVVVVIVAKVVVVVIVAKVVVVVIVATVVVVVIVAVLIVATTEVAERPF